MSLLMHKPEPRTVGQIDEFNIPMSQLLETAWGQGVHDTALDSISRMGELYKERNDTAMFGMMRWNNGDKISADDAITRVREAGLDLSFEEDVFQGELDMLMERKRKENFRNFVFSQGQKGIGRNIASIGTQMVASVSNPLDMSLMFVPVVGNAGKAKTAITAGKGYTRAKFAKGLVTEESLQAFPFPKITGAVIEGTVGAGIVEIPIAMANFQDQSDYNTSDFFFNIGAGGAFAGTMRAMGSATAKMLRGLQKQTLDRMNRTAISQMASGDMVNVAHHVDLDDARIRLEADFDEKGARDSANYRFQAEENARRVNSAMTYDLNHPTTMTLKKGEPVPEGYMKVGEDGSNNIYQSISKSQEDLTVSQTEAKNPARYNDVAEIIEADRAKSALEVKKELDPDGLGLASRPWLMDDSVDYNRFIYTQAMRDALRDRGFDGYLGFSETPENPKGTGESSAVVSFNQSQYNAAESARYKEARSKAINNFIAEEKRLQDPEERYRKILRQEIEATQAQGKILKTRDSDTIDDVESIIESDDPLLDNDIATLREELGDQAKSVKKEPTYEDGIDAAIDCLLKV